MAKTTDNLEQDIEATRERLAATIDQIAKRTNPKTLIAENLTVIVGVAVGIVGLTVVGALLSRRKRR